MGCHDLLQGIFLNHGSNPKSLESPDFGKCVLYHRCHCGNLTCIERQRLLDRSRTSRVKDVESHANYLNPDLPLDVFSHPISALCFSHLCLGFFQLQQKLFLLYIHGMERTVNGISFHKLSIGKMIIFDFKSFS